MPGRHAAATSPKPPRTFSEGYNIGYDAGHSAGYAFGRKYGRLFFFGRLEADNNAAERALRAVALGRKNWLFAGSDDDGERAAAMYTLIGTAKLNEIDPEAYLRYVLERIAEHPINQVDELLPWNVVAKIPSLRLAA